MQLVMDGHFASLSHLNCNSPVSRLKPPITVQYKIVSMIIIEYLKKLQV